MRRNTMRRNTGWRYESARHGLAAKGVKTGSQSRLQLMERKNLAANGVKKFFVPDTDEIWESGELIGTSHANQDYDVIEKWRYKGRMYYIGRVFKDGSASILDVVKLKKTLTARGRTTHRNVYDDHQTGKTNVKADRRVRAMRPGKRYSDEGSYYEHRRNRTDRNPARRL